MELVKKGVNKYEIKKKGGGGQMPSDFFTMGFLSTLAGMVVAVNVLTQVFKRFFGFGPRWLVLFFAFLLNFAMLYFNEEYSLQDIFLAVLNSFLVATAAIGTYQVARDQSRKRKL